MAVRWSSLQTATGDLRFDLPGRRPSHDRSDGSVKASVLALGSRTRILLDRDDTIAKATARVLRSSG